MPPHRKPVSLLHTVSLFGCHIRSFKEGLISFLLTWPGIHSLVIGTGVTLEKWEVRITDFHKRSWKFKPCSSKTFPFFFWNSWKEKRKLRNMHLKKITDVPKTKKHACGRRHCRKQMGWLVTHDLVPEEHVPIMPGTRLQQCRSPAFSEFANNNHSPSKLILIDHNFSSKHIQTAFFPEGQMHISTGLFYLTHWCFASPWGRPQCRTLWTGTQFVLETKYTPMNFVFTDQYIHLIYILYIYRK